MMMMIVYRGGLDRLAAWHLPGGPVGPPSRWAATSSVKVGQTTYPVNRGTVGMEDRKESEGQRHKKEEREGRSGMPPEFLVSTLMMGPVCLISQGRFEEPVRPSLYRLHNPTMLLLYVM